MNLAGQRVKISLFYESDLELFIELSMSPAVMENVYDPCSYGEAIEAFIAKSQPWPIESDDWLSFSI